MSNVNSYLPGFDAVLAAQKKAKKALLKWSFERLPAIYVDADEPFDVNETVGSPAPSHELVMGEPDSCMGFTCPNRSDVCGGDCETVKRLDEMLG